MTSNDGGGSGAGGALSDIDTVAIDVTLSLSPPHLPFTFEPGGSEFGGGFLSMQARDAGAGFADIANDPLQNGYVPAIPPEFHLL
jgi:hypothetical protein